MKSITDYFQREKKSDSSMQKVDSIKNSFDEDEPSSDVWVLYSSGDEVEGSDNEKSHKKGPLLVQVPQPILDLDAINRKRKRSCRDENISEEFSEEDKKILHSSVHGASEDECSFYMSPLRLESDSSVVTSPCSAKSKISATSISIVASSPVSKRSPSHRVSRRSLLYSKYESSCQEQDDVKRERINSDDNEKSGIDVEETQCLIKNETSFAQKSPNDFNCAVDERLKGVSIASKDLIVETKSYSDEESEINLQPVDEAVNSVASIMCTSSKNVSKKGGETFLIEVKKRTTSDDNLETLDDSQRKAKRRKSDIPKNALDDNPCENQNNLFNYFSRKETFPTVIKEDVSSDTEFESIHIDKSSCQEQVEERSHSPVICITQRKISRRKSETHIGTKLIKEEKGIEENAQDPSSQKSITSINGGDGSSSDISERRSSLRLKHKIEIKKESINSNEDEISPIIRRESKAQKKFGKNTAAKLALQDSQKVASQSGGVSKGNSSNADGEEIVVLTDSSSGSSKKVIIKEAYVRLAPLFLAKEELRKKQVFLQSGTPEVLRKKLQQQKQLEAELEERNEFPVISHVLQCNHRLFPWNLASKPQKNLPEREALPLAQQEIDALTMEENFHVGTVTDIPTLLANTLISARPPNLVDVELDFDFKFSSDKLDQYIPCFCFSQSSKDGTASNVTPTDVEKFLRVSLWIMRNMLPPGVAYKMHVDLSSFLPAPSPEGFIFDHISVLPTDQSCSDLKRKMLLKLKEDYPALPINRWYKNFYQKRKSYGGLCSYENSDVEDSEGHTSSANTNVGVNNVGHARRGSRNGSDSLNSSLKSVAQPKSCSSSESYEIAGKKKLIQEKLSSEAWTNIFSPRCFDDACILGKNLGSLNKLKDWLQKWKDRGSSVEKKTKAKGYCSDEDYSSGGEFYSSDDESNEDSRKTGKLPNVAILIGECGSGKTSGVYAIAKELGLKVLEINASSKRSGKNVLDAVKEATRSHQVNSSPLHSFLKNAGGINSAKKPKNLQQKIGESSGMSVIFVEDVDVVFDDRDDGFISALASLTSSSKRPFILEVHASEPLKMGSNNNLLLQEILIRSSPHLNALLAKQSKSPLLLPFQLTAKNVNSEALLRVICLCEGVWVSKQWCECIFSKSLGDFRQALQQAHFWAGSVARANILHEGLTRYSDDVLEDIKPAKKINYYRDNKIVANPCGCKNTHNCSYPYSWMFKDYIKQLWLNLDGIVNQEKANTLIKGHPYYKDPSNSKSISSCESNFQKSKTDSPLSTCKQHKMVVSPMEIETNIRNGNICLSEGKELLAESFSNETQLIMSCSPKVKAGKGNKGRKKTSARRRLQTPDDESKLKDQENNGGDEIPKMNDVVQEALHERKLQSHTGMKSYVEALDLLSTCDVFLSKFEEKEGNDLGRDMVFQMGILPDVINLFMQVTPSESSREMKAKMHKTACTASQSQLILPLLPTNWVLRNRMLAQDVLPHIRETCRIQNELAAMGRGRTRHSNRHPTLRQFGPSLRDALCATLVDNPTNISEDNCV